MNRGSMRESAPVLAGWLDSPWLMAALLGIAYHIGARIGLMSTINETGVSIVWIPNAITLAALLLTPNSAWIPLVIGSWMGDFTAEISALPFQDSVVFAGVNAAQTFICALLLRRFRINPIGNWRHYILFLSIYIGLAASAGGALVAFFLAHDIGTTGLWAMWRSWCVGDALFIMSLTPLLLALFRPAGTPKAGRLNEGLFLAVALLLASYLDLYLLFPAARSLSNVALPLLLWAALRFGIGGAAAASTVLITITCLSALSLDDALPASAVVDHLFHRQVMLFGDVCSAVILAIVSEDWRRAERNRDAALAAAQKAYHEAQRANHAKSQFLAAASHDLRQPFQAMKLYQHILESKLTVPGDRKVMQGLSTAIEAGQKLLNALLHISTIDAGTITPSMAEMPIDAVLSELVEECKTVAANRGLRLRYVPSSARVWTDRVLLQRMVRNLITNAIKYTTTGSILVGCRRSGGVIRIEVWDTGPGVPEEMQQEIWEEFVQIGNSERDQAKGLGLGLAIVAKVGKCLGHQVGLHSRPGKGSVFFVELRTPEAASPGLVYHDQKITI